MFFRHLLAAYIYFDCRVFLGLWTRKQLVGGTDSAGEPSLGLFARAQFYYKNPGTDPGKDKRGGQVSAVYQQFGKNAVAWLQVLRGLEPRDRIARPAACKVIQRSLTILTGTQTVERWLGEVQLAEIKSRSNLLGNSVLETSVKLNCQCFTGRRSGRAFNPDELLRGPAASADRGVRHQASNYCLRAQNIYRDWFGEKKIPARLLEGGPEETRPPGLGRSHKAPRTQETFKDQQKKHQECIKEIVSSSSAAERPGEKMLEGMVDEMKEVHLARTTPGSSTDKLVLEKTAPGPKTLPADMPAEGCEKNLALTLAFFFVVCIFCLDTSFRLDPESDETQRGLWSVAM